MALPRPLQVAAFPISPHVFTKPEALRSPSFGVFMEALLHRHKIVELIGHW